MTDEKAVETAVDRVGELLGARIGLRPESSLRGRLRRSIFEEARTHGGDIEAYVETLSDSADRVQGLVDRVTVQESGFFRHPDHFEVLARNILPRIDEPVTIWSAGCANGQEAYSLAMVLDEEGVRGSVVASDLSTAALRRTSRAAYTTREMSGVSAARRGRYLAAHGDQWLVTSRVRSRVATVRHNLVADLPAHVGLCQVVFCRNVLIYFSAEHARTFLDRLADAMPAGAYLFLGGAESLWQVTDRFTAVRMGDSFVYQRCELAPAPAAAPRRDPAQAPARDPAREPARDPAPAMRPVAARAVPAVPAVFEPDPLAPASLVAQAGRDALASEDHAAAVVAFRKWVYLAPDDPLAALHLGLALEAGGHASSARRAFGVARAVMHRVGPEHVEADLGGYAVDELLRLLETKQQGLRP